MLVLKVLVGLLVVRVQQDLQVLQVQLDLQDLVVHLEVPDLKDRVALLALRVLKGQLEHRVLLVLVGQGAWCGMKVFHLGRGLSSTLLEIIL